eukprot:TRINITY_DN11225_c0_g1_i1.p1 TRINITY_DN11225_c0_g1~~TRINITY_DN11225_c0_g1_i1.p1  ORF type:complete len:429 (-),score=64.03 TRINITY_DN11225_c0_g1_i1:2-1288(-)
MIVMMLTVSTMTFKDNYPIYSFSQALKKNKMLAWAKYQLSDGMIQETLAPGCLGGTSPIDNPGGRVMGDVTSAFIIEAYQIYEWTGDTAFLNQIWPQIKNAISWQINISKKYGLPSYMTCTYDILSMEQYELMAFNGFWHLVSMMAAQKLATIQNDLNLANACNQSYQLGLSALNQNLWNGNYYRAFTNPGTEPVMADTMYAQVWAFTLGLGLSVPSDRIKSHLQAELSHNDSPYGLLVLTGRHSDKRKQVKIDQYTDCGSINPIAQDNSIWMGGSPNWASLNIHLGMEVSQAMIQPEKALDRWRSQLNDQWNIHGLMGGIGYGIDGQPWCTSHYGFHMVLWHLPFAVSGQLYSAPAGTLSFSPKIPAPYKLPLLLPNVVGYLSRQGNTYSITVNKGHLVLNSCIVDGSKYPGTVNLSDGQTISWGSK